MKYLFLFIFASLFLSPAARALGSWQDFDRDAFYTAMASGDLDKIEAELNLVRAASFPEKNAYEGALLMRKSGLLKKAGDKLSAFKAGRIKFETAMQGDGDNAEYRFLRLTIQEHAPRVVKYFKDQESNKAAIQKGFKNLAPPVQKAIREYSKTSKVLRPEDL